MFCFGGATGQPECLNTCRRSHSDPPFLFLKASKTNCTNHFFQAEQMNQQEVLDLLDSLTWWLVQTKVRGEEQVKGKSKIFFSSAEKCLSVLSLDPRLLGPK